MSQLLMIGSTAALVLLVVHSWKTRGRAVTLAFFGFGILYGLLRENAIWLLMQHLTSGESGGKPYLPQGGFLPEIGHANLQVSVGWVFSMYLAWTISELILRRIPRLAGRVFMIAGLSGLFMLAICYCMETTAVAVGWWYWDLPTRSALFGNANTLGMEGWFSVVPDFLLPFLVIACADTRGKYLKWLWVLAFPLHILGHMAYTAWVYAYVVYHVLELLVVAPMMFSRMRMAKGEIQPPTSAGGKIASALPAAALIIFFAVLAIANVVGRGGMAAVMTAAPMLMLCLLAWRRAPAWVVSGLSLVAISGWAWMGPQALWALVPVAAYGFLTLLARLAEPLWARLIPVATVVALSVVSVVLCDRDAGRIHQYVAAWDEGDRLFLDGRTEEAATAYARADQLRPNYIMFFYRGVRAMTEVPAGRARNSARIFEYRMRRVTREFEEMVRRDPEFCPARRDLVLYYLLEGRLADAVQQCREIHDYRREDGAVASLFAWLLLRHGEIDEAEGVLDRLTQRRGPPPEALVNLGVIRFARHRDEDARRLWEQAQAIDPGNVMARVNLERLAEPSPDRTIDARYLARDRDLADLAWWVNDLAIHGNHPAASERLRLLLEATQMNPNLVPAHANAASIYLDKESGCCDLPRAVWHARRAVEGARASGKDLDLVKTLLLYGRALAADGKPEEARRALEEGRAKAPPEAYPDFDRALRELMP